MTPDEVCASYAKQKAEITTRLFENNEFVLIEGDAEALKFLGQLLLAQADFSDDGFQIGPNCAGNALFTKNSTVGLYLHRLDD